MGDSFTTGSITAGVTALQLPSHSCPNGVWLKTDPANSDDVFVGSSSAVTAGGTDATDGFPLDGGQEIFIPVTNTDAIWVIGGAAAQEVFFLVV